MGWIRRFVRARLQRRLFFWFGASIVASVAAAAVTIHFAAPGPPRWRAAREGLTRFVAARFAEVWDEPPRRARLARQLATELQLGVSLRGFDGAPLDRAGRRCRGHFHLETAVRRGGRVLGRLDVCATHHDGGGLQVLLALLAVGATLWGFAALVARRLARPLAEVARVAEDIGEGRLDSRVDLGRHHSGELTALGGAVNEMASRIARQMREQRELLAAVSHEIRTPLGHMRVLIELARDGACDATTLEQLERELLEIDDLVDQLLASSRLDFAALAPRPLDGEAAAGRALERAGLSAELLRSETGDPALEADPNLLARALANMLRNAESHGGGATALRLAGDADQLVFTVEDGGPGFAGDTLDRAFDPFVKGDRGAPPGSGERTAVRSGVPDAGSAGRGADEGGSLGLGLSLVARIARAHGGSARAVNRPQGGASVSLRLPRRPQAQQG